MLLFIAAALVVAQDGSDGQDGQLEEALQGLIQELPEPLNGTVTNIIVVYFPYLQTIDEWLYGMLGSALNMLMIAML